MYSKLWSVTNGLCLQQVPEDFERVMVGIQTYLGIRMHSHDAGLTIFESNEENSLEKKVNFF